jgi:acyl-CoA synthetase (AMP-forming)/AMP-acid ligase II
MNPAGLLHDVAARLPQQPAVTQGARTWSYAEFAQRVACTAGYLRGLPRVVAGARVAIAMENCPAFLQILYACWHAGLCPVPMNAKLHPKEFAYILENSQAAVCFASPALYAGMAAELGTRPGLQLIEVTPAAADRVLQNAPASCAETHPGDPGWLFYTSGTTGRPKGATITLRNLQFATHAYYADIDWLDERDCIIHPAPLSHGSGLYALPHIARGSHNVIPAAGNFAPGEVFELIERFDNVSFFAAPTMLVRLMNDGAADKVRTHHLKCIVYGGAPMYLSDLERALGLFGPRLFHLYGQGESPMTITGLSKRAHAQALAANDRAVLASAGVARTGVEVRVVDGNDQPLAAGEVGEIVTRSDCVMRGYWRNHARMSETQAAPEFALADVATLRGGWLHTGDVGSLDERGYLTLKDRSKDMIISGGSNIYPREIEDVLLLDARVAQASVVGAPHPEWGEEVVAFIVAKRGAAPTSEALDALCLQHIARYKRPRRYLFVDDLPKNNYGKVLKTALRERLQKSTAGHPQ